MTSKQPKSEKILENSRSFSPLDVYLPIEGPQHQLPHKIATALNGFISIECPRLLGRGPVGQAFLPDIPIVIPSGGKARPTRGAAPFEPIADARVDGAWS